jgi:hypothetical protein
MEPSAERTDRTSELRETSMTEPLDVLFIMPRLGFLRFFQSTLDLLIERKHDVRLLLESSRRDATELEWLEQALTRPNFSCEAIDHFKRAPLGRQQVALRLGMEYVRRMAPEYKDRVAGRPRSRLGRAPRLVRLLTRLPVIRTPRGLRLLYGSLATIDRALPVPPAVTDYLVQARPQVVAICDKGHPGSLSSAYVKAANDLGIPTALLVASWDNLTNRQRTRVVPRALLVWNERQRLEAVDFHGIPADRVELTGAPRFDDWFAWTARDRTEFLTRVGLDPTRPVLLWIGCALNPAEITEAAFVVRWITALRASGDPALRDAGVLIRPHPERVDDWTTTDYSTFENVALWPASGLTFPIGAEAKADYFDSIFHASAVVGINTSAMIEASIVGRPVLTVLAPEFHDSQLATFHFSYLLESGGGPVRVAETMDAHLDDLRSTLAGSTTEATERAEQFVHDFVRPLGLERPATEIFVETIEGLAGEPPHPERDPWWIPPLRILIVAVLQTVHRPRNLRFASGGRRGRKRSPFKVGTRDGRGGS